jgi:Type III flagellar switch regulator (C-ring) FliN C-term
VEKALRPYPWAALEEFPRELIGWLRDTRRALRRAVDHERLARALAELVGTPVEILTTYFGVASFEQAASSDVSIVLGTADEAVRIELCIERDLATKVVAAVVGRPDRLHDPRAPIDGALAGATAAIVCAVARRAHGFAEALRPLGPGVLRLQPGERRFEIRATVLIGEDAYGVRARLALTRIHSAPPPDVDLLTSLGSLPISIPVVIATATASREEIEALAPGDVFLPGAGLSIALRGRAAVGDVVLAAPTHGRGVAGTLGANGEIVVGGMSEAPLDGEAAMEGNRNDESGKAEAILEAPLVVRVELGAVTLTAREWASLGPGDVVPLGKRVGDFAVLRVAGIEVAEGELVDVEGELGVKIRTRRGGT